MSNNNTLYTVANMRIHIIIAEQLAVMEIPSFLHREVQNQATECLEVATFTYALHQSS